MNWLITGGCGFIGTSLVRYLTNQTQSSVRIIDNLTVGTRTDLEKISGYTEKDRNFESWSDGVELVIGDILNDELAVEIGKNADVIIHLAANTGVQPSIQNPRMDCMANVIGTLNYLESARKNNVTRFVFASSGGTVIGDCEPPIHEEMVPHPKSPYGASKSACEGYLSAYNGSFEIDTVALRFGNVYGPGSNHKNSVVAKFIRRALDGQALEIYGDGSQTRDFIYNEDLSHAIYQAATVKGIGGEVFQIATSQETTVNEIAAYLVPILEEANIKNIEVKHASPLPGEIKRNFSDVSKAKEKLDWQSATKLKDGMKKTVDWFLAQ